MDVFRGTLILPWTTSTITWQVTWVLSIFSTYLEEQNKPAWFPAQCGQLILFLQSDNACGLKKSLSSQDKIHTKLNLFSNYSNSNNRRNQCVLQLANQSFNQLLYQSITMCSKLIPIKVIAGHFAYKIPWSGLFISSHIQSWSCKIFLFSTAWWRRLHIGACVFPLLHCHLHITLCTELNFSLF